MVKDPNAALDLDAYLARIGYTGPRTATPDVLEQLHYAHITHIPFENLDNHLNRPSVMKLRVIQAKLVQARRGGTCYEQNMLLRAVLETLGFPVTLLSARVRLGFVHMRPRSHMILRVAAGGTFWLADVGFGAEGLLTPVPWINGQEVRRPDAAYRLVEEEAGVWVLQASLGGPWQDQYACTLEPCYLVDFEAHNHFAITHPSSLFYKSLTAQLPTPAARYVLRNRVLTVRRGTEISKQTIEDDEELLRVLAETFGLHFPPGTRFRCLQ